MSHIDPERLALFAMGEPVATSEESEHLADCAACVDDLSALRHVAIAGRASIDVGDLEAPPAAVWSRIAEELSLGTRTLESEDAGRTLVEPAPVPDRERAPVAAPVVVDAAAPRRRVMSRIWALAASLVLVAGVGMGVWAVNQRAAVTEIAEATLSPFPDHEGAEGTAVVEEMPDGTKAVRVQLNADAAPDTFQEVWLITADASALVSLGMLDSRDQTFAIPADVDLQDYVLVDVSQEPVDGDPTHSGDSIVRGELSFS
jgi:hypothetical protein